MLYYHSAAGFSSAETSLKIPIRTIKKIEKQESWGGVDTHLLIETDNGEDFTFRRFVNRRDECYSILIHLWSILRDTQPVFGAHLPDVCFSAQASTYIYPFSIFDQYAAELLFTFHSFRIMIQRPCFTMSPL